MLLKKLTLNNYANFENAEFNLWDEAKPLRKVTIFIGENGAGKSNILEAIATFMSWFVARIRRENGIGSPISEKKINNHAAASSIEICINHENQDSIGILAKTRKGYTSEFKSSLSPIYKLSSFFSEQYTKSSSSSSLPLFAYYNAERHIHETPINYRLFNLDKPINGYSNNISIGIDFSQFFNWFYILENIKNELIIKKIYEFVLKNHKNKNQKINGDVASYFQNEVSKEIFKQYKNGDITKDILFSIDDRLHFTTDAISTFLPEYKNIRIERLPSTAMLIDKGDVSLDIMQLSQGERSLLALVADIALRLTIMNPEKENPLLGEGIILIDEIDIHLHPRWQRSIVRNLQRTFPNCQFILTTHSPLVVSDPQDVQIFLLENGSAKELDGLYGMDIEQVLSDIMDTPLRYPPLQKKLDELMKSIQKRNFEEAKQLRSELRKELPANHSELQRADLFIRRMEAIDAAHKKA